MHWYTYTRCFYVIIYKGTDTKSEPINLMVWCEHPDCGQDYSTEITIADYDAYYSNLINFITAKNSSSKDNGSDRPPHHARRRC